MNPRTSPVGPRGAAVLGLAGAVGIVLAVHGWGSRPVTPSGAGLGVRSAASPTAAPTAGPRSASPARSATAHGPPAGSSPGPSLASQAYAQYAFAVWPGNPSATAKAAETGLTIAVSRGASGLTVTAGVSGQSAGSPRFYPAGARVYVVEATLGDDSGGADYNLGDDGVVVTDARGRIVP